MIFSHTIPSLADTLDASSLHILIIYAEDYDPLFAEAMVDICKEKLVQYGHPPSQLAIEKVPHYKDLPLATQSLVESTWKLDSSPNCDAVIWIAHINGHPDNDGDIPDYHPIKYQTQLSLELNLPIIPGFIPIQDVCSVRNVYPFEGMPYRYSVTPQKVNYHGKYANSGQCVWVEKAIKLALFSKKTLQFGV